MLSRVAALEPVIEFPDYIFTQIPEARHLPGTIGIDGDLMIKLLDNVCREIARNGCKKVVLLNAHGGNFGLVALYAAHGTAEAGERILDALAQSIARAVRAIKADTAAKQLQDEFFAASQAPA